MFPVTCTRTYRTAEAVKEIPTVFAPDGSNTRPVDTASVLKAVPSVLPSTLRVSVRAPQEDGSFSATEWMLTLLPRSTCTHCGNAPAGLSQ